MEEISQQPETTTDVEEKVEQPQFQDLLGLSDNPELLRLAGECPTLTLEDLPVIENHDKLDYDARVPFPSLPYDITDQVYNLLPQPSDEDTPERNAWYKSLTSSIRTSLGGAAFQERLEMEGSDFTNKPIFNGHKLQAEPARFGPSKDGTLTGDNVRFRVQQALGTGAVVQIPLWHSGFWVTLRAPTEGAMLDLYDRLRLEKINLGRMTYGAAYSNQTVFFTAQVMEFVMDHLIKTTLPSLEDVRALIKSTDIYLLAWGLALTVWPRGFPYIRAIVGDPDDPNKIITQKINLHRALIVDRSVLNDYQRNHMTKRGAGSVTVEEVEAYQKQHRRGQDQRVVLKEGNDFQEEIAVVFSVPTMDMYLNSGEEWINQILLGFEKAAGIGGDDKRRNEHMENHARATLMRQYGHWVKEVHIGTDKIVNRGDVDNALGDMTPDEDITTKYFDEVRKYMRDSSFAIIAVPTYRKEDNTLDTHPFCFPIDPVSTFFILLVQKLEKLSIR